MSSIRRSGTLSDGFGNELIMKFAAPGVQAGQVLNQVLPQISSIGRSQQKLRQYMAIWAKEDPRFVEQSASTMKRQILSDIQDLQNLAEQVKGALLGAASNPTQVNPIIANSGLLILIDGQKLLNQGYAQGGNPGMFEAAAKIYETAASMNITSYQGILQSLGIQ